MGKKGKWFGVVKKVFSPESKEKKDQKSKKKWGFGATKHSDPNTSEVLENSVVGQAPAPLPHPGELKPAVPENEQSKQATSAAPATASAATSAAAAAAAAEEAAAATTQAAAEVATASTRLGGKSREEIAAIKIQTAFRGYLARRALRALRGLVRLKSLIHGNSVKRQATTTLRCMQTLARVQSQIRARRLKMSEENQALQRQLLLKREREIESLRLGEEWDDSLQSREQIEASLMSKQEAAIRRERALAYAFSHQWKSSSRSVNPMFMDPNNPQWGWSWLERWMAARPWENRSTADKENNNDHASIKSMGQNIGEGEITRAYARRDSKPDKPSPTTPKLTRPASRLSPSTPSSKTLPVITKSKSATPKNGRGPLDDDVRSILSIQSEFHRRHSIAGSSIRDDESLASSPAVPSYMATTESAKAKSRFHSPSIESVDSPLKAGSLGSVKKRLSFPAADKHSMTSPAAIRRHSGPPKVEVAVKEVGAHPELHASNGGNR
ncbi:protein IQ-DOMAIN 2 isoform X2 [Typha angustifolia]|uniref:protein IQ-DOMAIN 2 isoform X2 n=1 Tax=Typha angustifolia TaxID=59011 RepID=UPI003C2BA676